jgi:hypothetical protein
MAAALPRTRTNTVEVGNIALSAFATPLCKIAWITRTAMLRRLNILFSEKLTSGVIGSHFNSQMPNPFLVGKRQIVTRRLRPRDTAAHCR